MRLITFNDQLKFDDLKVEKEGRSNPNPLEITLLEGVIPNLIASSVPYAHPPEKNTNKPGIPFTAYLYKKEKDCLHLTFDILKYGKMTELGGVVVHKDAIYSIMQR